MADKVNRIELIKIMHESNRKLFEEVVQDKVEKFDFRLGISPTILSGYCVVMELVEDIDGTLIINISRELAEYITERMNGFKLEELGDDEERDELIEATIGEVINMIGGRAISEFHNLGLECNITPPTIFYGEKLKFISRGKIVYELPYKLMNGDIKVYVTIEKKRI